MTLHILIKKITFIYLVFLSVLLIIQNLLCICSVMNESWLQPKNAGMILKKNIFFKSIFFAFSLFHWNKWEMFWWRAQHKSTTGHCVINTKDKEMPSWPGFVFCRCFSNRLLSKRNSNHEVCRGVLGRLLVTAATRSAASALILPWWGVTNISTTRLISSGTRVTHR